MSDQKHRLRTFIALVAMLFIGGVVGWVIHAPLPFRSHDGFRNSPPELANVFVSWDIPEQAIAGNGYQIDLNLQELQGIDRVITEVSVEGFMLTRALGFNDANPTSFGSTSNVGDGWIDYQFQIPLDALQKTTISLYGNTTRAGPAYGEIVIGFKSKQSVRIPISFEIKEE